MAIQKQARALMVKERLKEQNRRASLQVLMSDAVNRFNPDDSRSATI